MKGKKGLLLILTFAIALLTLQRNATAADFEGNEDYYNNICSGYITTDDPNRAVCKEYKDYLIAKKKEANNELASIKTEIASLGSDLASIEATSKKLSAEIEQLYTEMATLEKSIKKIDEDVQILEEKIKEKTLAAEKRKALILERIPKLAVKANTNQYIDFIMGASDFVELIQRSSSIETFTKYDKELISTYKKEVEELEAEKEEQTRLQEQQKLNLETLEASEEELRERYELNQQLASKYHEEQEALIAKKTEAERLIQVANAAANKITFVNNSITGSSGLISPIPNGYTSAGTWAYPSGALHRGLDKACSIGTPIYAPANGIVLSARTATQSSGGGYLGNMLGYPLGGGNTLHILVQANDQVYGITFAHMSPNIISTGTRISQGQLIGYTGNTGNSTGPHCHIEVYKLNMNFDQAVAYWNSNFDWAWGCSWNAGSSCSSAGCRIRPESLGW